MTAITLSIFDMLKVGPGPSSSHTIGPMRAGLDFLHIVPPEAASKAYSLRVRLFGSLSATGKGHGTDRAVTAGLLGTPPESCSALFLDELAAHPTKKFDITLPGKTLTFAVSDVIFSDIETNFPFSNTLVIDLLDEDQQVVFEREYYSVGGGFIQWKGWQPPQRGTPIHAYSTMAEFQALLAAKDISLHQAMLENEAAISGSSVKDIEAKLDMIRDVMINAVKTGLSSDGLLPGPLQVHSLAATLYASKTQNSCGQDDFMVGLNAYALAASEENARGHCIVTAPTCGAAGVVPGVLYALQNNLNVSDDSIRRGLLAATAIGFLCKHNASIAGAEVGCQGEIGVASAMAAAMLVSASNLHPRLCDHAAATALEHHLGMTCDPVMGYVQVPCIERNAMGAIKAYNAYLIAKIEKPAYHKVPLDAVIQAMAESGRDMNKKYKETSLGGLAVSLVNC
ncbi:L-serine ammonia-lyase [Desulfovibrio inopinatus]|uniref:L-serine ammonia-lyase n=1 Tax=Desulfovibrio inopinatus TaxID=102109 RepID=UPI000400540C|nr:L-serine ammonia-lyase [Desulfovibrio inopinatus]